MAHLVVTCDGEPIFSRAVDSVQLNENIDGHVVMSAEFSRPGREIDVPTGTVTRLACNPSGY